MAGRGSIRRMRLSAFTDLARIFPVPVDDDGNPTGPPGYAPEVFRKGKGMIDDLVLVGGLKYDDTTKRARLYTIALAAAFEAKWKTLVNDCHADNIEVCLGLAPQDKFGDGKSFEAWLYQSSSSDRATMAASIKHVLDAQLPGSSGVSFDCEYLFTPRKIVNGKPVPKIYPEFTDAEKATFADRRAKLTDFYHQIADAISPLRAVVITGAKSGDKLTDEQVHAFDHSLLHDWPAIATKRNVLVAAMGYMYDPSSSRTLEDWHRAVLRYATAPAPSGYVEDRAHLRDEQFQLVLQVANTAAKGQPPSAGIASPDEVRHRGWLCRIFNNGLGVFPASAGSYSQADELLNKRPGVRPEDPRDKPADAAPPPGTKNQPVQMPVVDPAVAFRKV